MLSSASKSALRATLFLAVNSNENKKFGAKEIASELKIPQPFLSKVLQKLTKHGIVSSIKGPKGGFYFTSDNGEKRAYDILELIDGKDVLEECFLGMTKCDDDKPCPVHEIVRTFYSDIFGEFKCKNLNKLAEEIRKNGTFLA